ncbi:MAG: hypothetical protein JJT90_10005 [Ectothiorhodospiraceae bacterium]|nr:hypothetical protein [Ectothiorhodospiraceae bacterium]
MLNNHAAREALAERELATALCPGQIHRLNRRVTWEESWNPSCEFPMVHPSRLAEGHRDAWVAAHDSADGACVPA